MPVTKPLLLRALAAATATLACVAMTDLSTSTTAVRAATPLAGSGASAPATDPPGWTRVVTERFNGATLPSGWHSYDGHPGGNPDSRWVSSHAVVADGMLTLKGNWVGGKWTTAGVGYWPDKPMTYGKYQVRFRMDPGHGTGYAILLWPDSERWPADGEIDFAEDGARDGFWGNVHYGASDHVIHNHLAGIDLTQWHTLGVEWTKGRVALTIDGRTWATVLDPNVPSSPMHLAIQAAGGICGDQWLPCADSRTPPEVDAQIAWVTISRAG